MIEITLVDFETVAAFIVDGDDLPASRIGDLLQNAYLPLMLRGILLRRTVGNVASVITLPIA